MLREIVYYDGFSSNGANTHSPRGSSFPTAPPEIFFLTANGVSSEGSEAIRSCRGGTRRLFGCEVAYHSGIEGTEAGGEIRKWN